MKYKLVKKYPGSPELGTIAEKCGNSIKMGNSFSTSTTGCFFERMVANQPEFWKEIVEKSLTIAGNICVFTNQSQTIDEL